jgi:iron complex outermembrane receptor protein
MLMDKVGEMRLIGRHCRAALLGGAAGLALVASPAFAQDAGSAAPIAAAPQPQTDASANPYADDIVITAQKREEKLQNVPIAVSVVPAATLAAFNVNEATDLQYFVPGVQVLNAAGPRSFGFYIRGVGTTSFSSESVEGSVAFVVDGVVMGQSGASLADLPDIERVEVLKGPQATLFGKNASAGVINVVTRRPSDHWEGKIDASWAWPLNERKLSGLITGPITDTVRVMLSGRVNKRDGNVTNLHDGRDLNNRNDYGFRGKLEFTPDDRLTTTLIGDWWQRRADCCIWTLRRVGPTPNALELSQIAAGIVPSPSNEKQNVDGDVRSDVDSWGISLDNEYELGGNYTISAITAFRSWHSIDGLDTDSQPTNIYNVNYADFRQHQFSQELRLTSPKSGLIDYVLGAFYFHQAVTSISYQDNKSSVAAFAGKAVTNDATTDNYAVFGQANINLSKQFRLIAGGRWVSETAFASKYRLDTRSLATSFSQARKTNSALLWRFGAQYDLSKDANVFATITRGFKGGGYDTGIGFANLPDVKPERPTNSEIGIRTSWPDAGLTFNVTAFHTIVEDYQISARAPGALSVYYLINAAKLRSNGVEFDLSWRPIRSADFVISAGGMYDKAIFKSFPNAQCWAGQTAAQGCVGGQQNLTGTELPHAPKWSGNLMASYTGDLGANGWKYHLDADVNYHSRAGQGFPISPWMYQNAYALMNMSIGLSGKNDLWRVSVFGRNLTDKNFATNIGSTVLGSSPGSTQQYPLYEARRVIGVALGLKF